MEGSTSTTPPSSRPERVISHALVEIRRYRWWPLGVHSAVLLDLSPQGFKAEFTGKVSCKTDETFWMQIPLSPFGIAGPGDVLLKIVIKWFDPTKMRIGGVFEMVEPTQSAFLEKIIEKVKAQAL